MSHLEETVLRTESGINLNQKGEKKYRFNPPSGTLILTDQRIIFAQSGGEFAKRLVVGGLLGGIVGSEAMRLATKVKKEQLDEALQRPDSFEIHLQDITNMSQRSEFGAKLLMIESRAPGVEKAHLYRQGGLSGIKGFEEWMTDINGAKARAPAQYAPQPVVQQPYQPQPAMQYSAPAPPMQPATGARICPSCGQAANPQDKFCQNWREPTGAARGLSEMREPCEPSAEVLQHVRRAVKVEHEIAISCLIRFLRFSLQYLFQTIIIVRNKNKLKKRMFYIHKLEYFM